MRELTQSAHTLAGIEAAVPGFTAAVEAFDADLAGEYGPDDPREPFLQWFEGNGRWAATSVWPDGRAEVVVYEGTGQYCDSWVRVPGLGWVHVEGGATLAADTWTVRRTTDADLDLVRASGAGGS